MLATVNIASQAAARRRGMAEDASLLLEVLTLLQEGHREQAAARLNELGRSRHLLKITAALCADPATSGDLALRRTRRRFLSVMEAQDSPGALQRVSLNSARRDGAAPLRRDPTPTRPRQVAVLASVKLGLNNPAIAVRLGISLNTVKWHLKSAARMLGARNRVDLVIKAQARGLI